MESATRGVCDQHQAVSSKQAAELVELLQLVGSGCNPAFERLYQRTSRRLFGIILQINNDRGEAEELLQDTYVKIWNQCQQFEASKGLVTTWLISIARHTAIDSLRRKKVRPVRKGHADNDSDDPYAEFASLAPGPFESLMLQRRAGALKQCIDALNADQRESLTLAFYGGLSYQEIAYQMDRPVGTIKSWMRRSLMLLRRSFDAAHCFLGHPACGGTPGMGSPALAGAHRPLEPNTAGTLASGTASSAAAPRGMTAPGKQSLRAPRAAGQSRLTRKGLR